VGGWWIAPAVVTIAIVAVRASHARPTSVLPHRVCVFEECFLKVGDELDIVEDLGDFHGCLDLTAALGLLALHADLDELRG